jgi:hypothetical protein
LSEPGSQARLAQQEPEAQPKARVELVQPEELASVQPREQGQQQQSVPAPPQLEQEEQEPRLKGST